MRAPIKKIVKTDQVKKRIIKENPTSAIKGEKEQELDCDSIRFEIGNNNFSVYITDEGIDIYKTGRINDTMIVKPQSANRILIR